MPNKILQRVQMLLEKGQCQGFPIPIWIDWSLLTLLHPGEVSSSLASPHGNSRSSSENCLSRRQRRQQLLLSSPGRRLYSASLASPRPGCSRRTRRHLGRATSACPLILKKTVNGLMGLKFPLSRRTEGSILQSFRQQTYCLFP